MTKILGVDVLDDSGVLLSTETDTIVFEWCCDCSLRHIVIYDPTEIKGKLYLRKRFWRDDLATKLRRYHSRSQAKRNLKRKK